MKKGLRCPKHLVWGIVMLGTIMMNYAQQPNIQSPVKPLQKKQTLKNQQMFSSKKGSMDANKFRIQRDNALLRAEWEYLRLRNPFTGDVPLGIREAEITFSSKIATGYDSQKSLKKGAKSAKSARFSNWVNRGPGNVGGRTRALAIDRTNENVILAGGVSGGLWRSENGGQSWRKVTRPFQNPSITSIVQDPRPGRGFTWYYGSGERFGNSAGAGGGFFQGNGVYKSQDGGRTWRQLQATVNEDVGVFESGFDLINSVTVNPLNGDLFVATFNGLFRSQDGGNSFTEVLESGFDNYVEIDVTSTGILYATIESDGVPNAGYLTSNDGGDTWTNITPPNVIPNFGRTKMGIDPSNENIVYFFSSNRDPGGEAALYKYDALAASAEEAWVDLTENLPGEIPVNFGLGNLNLQGGYNMVCKVHPAQPNIVFVGGTNLYRSTTGFTTPSAAETWIGGNGPGDVDFLLNTVGTDASYTNQHADQHALVFFPSNPNKAIAGHDGGLSMTEDITVVNDDAEQVTWESLNNGYITMQPYHVAFDPESENQDLLAGFQDNGSWYTNSTNPEDAWIEQLGADGAYNAIADNGRTRYASSQFGGIRRLNFDDEGNRVSFAGVSPASASGLAFVTPFILSPTNDNVMYLPAGNFIWRNNNLDEVPVGSTAGTDINWVRLGTSGTPVGSSITSLDISKFPVANRLYYGTNNGLIFRMENANIDGQEAVDIATGRGLPPGFVNDINVDPSNSDRVIVTFSNYGIPSVFITEDAGETWTNISGNLEENSDGSGNGPSVRSTAFFGGSQGFFGARLQRIFAATSTGLYYTNRLNGQNTVWRKENVKIGNAVTDEVIARKDGFIAVASHGSGMFSARFPIFNQLSEPTLTVNYLLDDVTADINELASFEVSVDSLFTSSTGSAINIELQNTNPEVVTATLNGDTILVEYVEGAQLGDQATIALIATSGDEQVAEGFTVTISELPIYNQNSVVVTSIISQNNALGVPGALVQVADDFVVPEGNTWSIERILAFGTANGDVVLNNATVVIYTNENGAPGEEVYNSGEVAPISQPNESNINLLLPEPVSLESGAYWISFYANIASGRWNWSGQNAGIGIESQLRDVIDIFGAGATDWTPLSLLIGNPIDQVFDIYGTISGDTTEAGAEAALLDSLSAETVVSVYPNPSADRFVFNMGKKLKSKERLSLSVYNIAGSLVYHKSNLSSQFEWDASAFTRGFYFVNVSSESGISIAKMKILKK